jgi:hypothetical protein
MYQPGFAVYITLGATGKHMHRSSSVEGKNQFARSGNSAVNALAPDATIEYGPTCYSRRHLQALAEPPEPSTMPCAALQTPPYHEAPYCKACLRPANCGARVPRPATAPAAPRSNHIASASTASNNRRVAPFVHSSCAPYALYQAASTAMRLGLPGVAPNPSFKRSTSGRPPAPGRWYAVHFHRPGAGVLPLAPA